MTEQYPNIEAVFIACDKTDERTHEAYGMLTKSLAGVGVRQTVELTDAAAMIVIGGDGTFVRAMHEYDFPDIPVRGVNTGTIGFFMATEPTEVDIDELATNLVEAKYTTDALSVLDARGVNGEFIGHALNDAVIRSSSGQALHMHMHIDGADFGKMTGDGMIVSTASGATAYAKSAGGPFMQDTLRAYEVVPLNPYYSFMDRPAIIDGSVTTRIRVEDTEKRPYQLTIDGQEHPLTHGNEYSFGLSERQVRMIRFDGYEYYKKLYKKLVEVREVHSM